MIHNNLNRRDFLKQMGMGLTAASLTMSGFNCSKHSSKKLPNIIFIMADDMGYGDVACLNEQSKIPTPNMDRLAKEGMIFTDAHSGSAVCTPTRYGVLTGRYSWRTRLQSGVLGGYSRPLMKKKRKTVASLLKDFGYSTSCIGKWHLGLDWQVKDEFNNAKGSKEQRDNVDYSKRIENGPNDFGFDYFFGIPASLDMTPYVYIKNDRVVQAPTEIVDKVEGKAFYRGGPCAPDFKHEDVLPTFTDEAVNFIDRHAEAKPASPFFLYFPLAAPHTPILPTEEFKGKTGIGPYGDFVNQCDWTIGQVVEALERNGLTNNTLIFVTSDNGCSPMADFKELAEKDHFPSYHFRGHKADIFEGGHRIPFIVRWPEKIQPDSECDDTICLTDLMATAADVVDAKLPDNAGEDSVSILPDLLGTAKEPIREATVHHSINGSFSIRQGKWKLELCPGSGGWSNPKPKEARRMELPKVQLYDLSLDISERKNVYDRHPEIVERLTNLLQKYVDNGRSTPGKAQKNDSPVNIWKE